MKEPIRFTRSPAYAPLIAPPGTALSFQYCGDSIKPVSARISTAFSSSLLSSILLKKIYEYANSSIVDNDADLVIGNVMRRALEAFSSFSFKLGINEVSLDERVLHLLPDEETRMYYRNLMYRLVLNNESHYMENIQGDPQMSFFSHLSPSEKQRTAKDILCFIYRLNKAHVLSHLPEAESKLELWCLR